jgi:hypothetical protein
MREMRNAYKILFWETEGKSLLTKYRHTWQDDVKIYLREIEYALDSCGSG